MLFRSQGSDVVMQEGDDVCSRQLAFKLESASSHAHDACVCAGESHSDERVALLADVFRIDALRQHRQGLPKRSEFLEKCVEHGMDDGEVRSETVLCVVCCTSAASVGNMCRTCAHYAQNDVAVGVQDSFRDDVGPAPISGSSIVYLNVQECGKVVSFLRAPSMPPQIGRAHV